MRTLRIALAAALALGGLATAATAHEYKLAPEVLATLPDVSDLPEGTVKLSPVVPAMGEHYGNPQDMPLGPIYCGYDGKVVCLEYMMTQEDFARGVSWTNLKGMDGLPPIDHVNIEFQPNGHEGFEVPHYDIHMYFIPSDAREAIR